MSTPIVVCEQTRCSDREQCWRYMKPHEPGQKATIYGCPATMGERRCKHFVPIPEGKTFPPIHVFITDDANRRAWQHID